MRHPIGKETAQRFCSSLKERGFLRPLFTDGDGRIVDGAKRYSSSLILGYDRVPCVRYPSPLIFADDMIFSRLVREELWFFEFAELLRLLAEKHLYSQESIATAIGRSQSFVANKLRLLAFSPAEREFIEGARLTERHCRALLKIKDKEARARALDRIISAGMNVSAAEYYISSLVSESEDGTGGFVLKLRSFLKNYSDLAGVSATETRCPDGSVVFSITVSGNVSRETQGPFNVN